MEKDEIVKQIEEMTLNEVFGSTMCEYSVLENKIKTLANNQKIILNAIKLLSKLK